MNSIVMSIETRIRILLQICTAVYTLWEEKNIILYVKNVNRIFVTKNLTIKIRNLSQHCKVEPYMMLEDKTAVNRKLVDNFLNLSEIYFMIFLRHNISFARPSSASNSEMQFSKYSKSATILKNIVGSRFIGNGVHDPIQDIVVGLNYIFLEFVDKAQRLIVEPMMRMERREVFTAQGKVAVGEEDA